MLTISTTLTSIVLCGIIIIEGLMKPKKCKHCGRLVSIAVYNLGYCKKCIAEAKKEQQVEADVSH